MPIKRWSLVWGMAVPSALLLVSPPASATFQVGDEDAHIKLSGLLQVQASTTEDAAPSGDAFDKELYVRRMRLMFYGKLNPWLSFFVETDDPNFGRNGNFGQNMFIQDAYLEVDVDPALQIDAGMLLLPFSHHGMQSAASLLTVDYHRAIFYPAGSTRVWRDFGVMARGMPIGKWLEYRVGVFNGVRGTHATPDPDAVIPVDLRNPDDYPRLTGRLTLNLLESEVGPGVGGFYVDGLYLKKEEGMIVSTKEVLSLGVSADFQPDLVVNANAAGTEVASRENYVALAGDVFWDIPLGVERKVSLNGQINGYYYDYGDRSEANVVSPGITGLGVASEVGFRYDFIEPYLAFDAFEPTANPEGDDTGSFSSIYGGLSYWALAHTFNLKGQFGATTVADGPWTLSGLAQVQLLF